MTAPAPEKPTVVEAIAAVMGDVAGVGKHDRNTAQNFNFRGIDAVINAVGPALRKHKVVIMPTVEDAAYRNVEVGQKKTPMRECTLRVRYAFYGPAGDHIETVVYAESLDSGDKATAKAHSVAFRTALLQTLAIPTDEPDPDTQSYERAAPAPVRDENAVNMWIESFTDSVQASENLDELRGDIWKKLGEKARTGFLTESEFADLKGMVTDRAALIQASAAPEQSQADPETEPPPQSEPHPPASTVPQLKKMHALFSEKAITDRVEQLAQIASLIGRPVNTSKDCTRQEAAAVIEALEKLPAVDKTTGEISEKDGAE